VTGVRSYWGLVCCHLSLRKESCVISRAARQQADEFKVFVCGLNRMKPDRQRQLIERLIQDERNGYADHLEAMWQMMADSDYSDIDDEEAAAFGGDIERIPELLFYFRVVLPCMVAYKMHPTHLLRRARQGDRLAIKHLVRVDEMAVHEPAIEAWARHEDGKIRLMRQQMLRDWANEGMRPGRYSLQQVQQSMGGLIQAVIDCFGGYIDWNRPGLGWQESKITANDIRELFLAVHDDRMALCPGYVGSNAALMDLQADSWGKRLRDHRLLWIRCLTGDVNKS